MGAQKFNVVCPQISQNVFNPKFCFFFDENFPTGKNWGGGGLPAPCPPPATKPLVQHADKKRSLNTVRLNKSNVIW